jgi:uncharacterized iron-regulated membrane protein
MSAFLFAFFATGAVFGWFSFATRHHFSEGSTRAADGNGPWQRAGWVLLCAVLWPLMLVSGAFGWWARRARRVSSRSPLPRRPGR